MKMLISLLFTVCAASISQGEVDAIKIIPAIKKADHITVTPSTTILPGARGVIDMSKEFIQDTKLFSLPTGIVIEAIANFEGQKISYSVLVTIREHKKSSGSTLEKATSNFETSELMLSGVTSSGEKIEAKVDNDTTFIISFEPTKIEEKGSRTRR